MIKVLLTEVMTIKQIKDIYQRTIIMISLSLTRKLQAIWLDENYMQYDFLKTISNLIG